MEQWRTDFARDITNAENPLPNGEYLLDKVDIWALTDLYRHHQGEDGVKWLFTELLGIPYRNAETGAVVLQPAAEPLLNFANLPQPPRQSKEKDLLMNRILADKNAVEQEHVPIAPRLCSYWEEQHEQLRVQKMQTLNEHMREQEQQEEAPFVYTRTAIKDRRSLTIEMVSRRNWAGAQGQKWAESDRSNNEWLRCFRKFVEQNCAVAQLNLTTNNPHRMEGILKSE